MAMKNYYLMNRIILLVFQNVYYPIYVFIFWRREYDIYKTCLNTMLVNI